MEGNNQQAHSFNGGGVTYAPHALTVAHELKSPLSLVRQLSLQLEKGNLTTDEVVKTAQKIALTSERALRLTTNLTRTNNLEGQLFALEPLNTSVLCYEIADELKPLCVAKGRSIIIKNKPRLQLGLTNRDLLRRILINFTDNALNYSNSNHPVILTTKFLKKHACIRLQVRDYGPSLPSNLRKNIGNTVQTHHSRPESSGLGIYIAKQFADAIGAKIGAISHNDGTSFYVDIAVSSQLRLL